MPALTFGVAYPDPPFNGVGDERGGLDVDLITAIGVVIGSAVNLVPYQGSDFEGIFDSLVSGAYDGVISGTTVTAERKRRAAFASAYLDSGQSLAVNVERFPRVTSVEDLAGLTVGVQQGNTSQPIAERLVAQGKAGAVRVYDYGGIRTALSDLTSGGCDAFMKLAPVLTELVRNVDKVEVVARGLSREEIAIAVALDNGDLLERITSAQATLESDGTLPALRTKWLGNPHLEQSLVAH